VTRRAAHDQAFGEAAVQTGVIKNGDQLIQNEPVEPLTRVAYHSTTRRWFTEFFSVCRSMQPCILPAGTYQRV